MPAWRDQPKRCRLRPGAALAIGLGGVATAAGALLLAGSIGSGLEPVGQAALLYLMVAAAIAIGLRQGGGRFGPADWITLLRASVVCALAGLIGSHGGGLGWLLPALGLAVLLLDGVDGWVARRTGTSSEFGACFDREVDALLVLVLAMLAVDIRGVGPWILLAGALRYAFVAGRIRWPWLAAPLPPSRRRRAVFAIQVLLLAVCLMPLAGTRIGTGSAAAALALVTMSFAIDVFWLRRIAAKEASPCRGAYP